MKLWSGFLLVLVCIGPLVETGCGTHPATATITACPGAAITGTLNDSLTGQPVAKGSVALENVAPSPLQDTTMFSVASQAVAGENGSFSLCASTVTPSSLLVATALDISGNAYPAYLAPISSAKNIGKILMGGCMLTCGLDNQQQTSLPATIQGQVTTQPKAESVQIAALYPTAPLDGSKGLWLITLPDLADTQTSTVVTSSNGCTAGSTPCASYRFELPSQNAMIALSGGARQLAGVPGYLIYASASSCTPSLRLTALQQDGKTPLLANPGATLNAATLSLQQCQ